MVNTNYIITIVRILENPSKTFLNNNLLFTKFRAQFPQSRNNQIINLICWDNLALNINQYYQTNDYIIVEGYLSSDSQTCLNKLFKNSKKIEVTVLKIYPFLLS
jgi:single-stranded DNA-binding protein